MARGLQGKTVKSAERVLELLQYVGQKDGQFTVMDVARDLSYPQSSTSELLSCLVHLGYLRHNRASRTFEPTARIASIGHTRHHGAFTRNMLFRTVDVLAESFHSAVTVGMVHEGMLIHIHLAGDRRPLSRLSNTSPLHSALGKVLVAKWPEKNIRGLVHRLNAEAGELPPVSVRQFLEEAAAIRQSGYSVTSARPNFEGRMVSCALPLCGNDHLSIAVILPACSSLGTERDAVAAIHGAIGRASGSRPVNLDGARQAENTEQRAASAALN